MELRHLRYFIAVAETLNISQAAKQLEIKQPPLSQQIQALETELDVQLFDRTKRPLELTPAGKMFLEQTRLVLAQVDQAIELTQRASRGEIGRFRVGFNSSVSNSILPDLLKNFRARCPDVELILQERTAYSLIEGLQEKHIDIGLMHWSSLNPQDERLEVYKIKEESLILVLPENHSLAPQIEISLKSLDNESFILPPSHLPYSFHELIANFWKQAEFVPKETQEATLMLTILSLVAGGFGVAILPENVQNIGRKGVVYRTIQETTPRLQIVAIWRKDNCSIILHQFREVVKMII